ncbi:MAG: CTP synthase [Candidatus Liptonbacteria bacterium]|nr:CTP synthase [Candidatus Liptonbacteria bacterium]
MTRYIFVVGGVMSGIGKGVGSAAIAALLKDRGFRVTAVKIDPYINVDAGTMNPVEHGEVFVTEDGLECDQDIGNYERFLDTNILRPNYMTTGLVYQTVIDRERRLEYGGKCVEVVPHIPEEVIRRIKLAAKKSKAQFALVEIGGTAGEYQNLLFLEAARIMKLKDPASLILVLVSYLPVPQNLGEMKTKPTQYAVRTLNSAGLQPDIILARSVIPIDKPRKEKISIFCNVLPEDIISAPDIKNIYEVPLNFEKEKLADRILKKFSLKPRKRDGSTWRKLQRKIQRAKKPVRIGIVGKYFATGDFTLSDSYISVIEAIKHAAWELGRKPVIDWINAEVFETNPRALTTLESYAGIIVPGGFGGRGIEGKIKVIGYAREHKIPYFGLCYGMQLATIEFARHIAKLKGAYTTEIDPKTPHPVIAVLPEQARKIAQEHYGGSMRLGAYKCRITKGTIAEKAYRTNMVRERHRHRYEFNNKYREKLEKAGLVFSGVNPETNLVEIIELKNHPFFVGTQFHPELKSRPMAPHPLFVAFIKAAIAKK